MRQPLTVGSCCQFRTNQTEIPAQEKQRVDVTGEIVTFNRIET